MDMLHRVRTVIVVVAVCTAGATTAAVASGSGGDRPRDRGTSTSDDTTTRETTTGESTTTTTGTTTTTTTGTTTGRTTTTTPSPTRAGGPRIVEVEADALARGRFRLRAEVAPRGRRVTSVRFTYRGVTVRARRFGDEEWSRVVRARGGDRRGDVLSIRVRACAGSRCTTMAGRDEAGG